MNLELASEAALTDTAACIARAWRDASVAPLLVGFSGPLGSGKTTWVRAMLRGLGYEGRVPSPTYTLLEDYRLGGLTVVHLDLYRLATADELEYLGIRDWLEDPGVWLLVEWPERSLPLVGRLDLALTLVATGTEARRVGFAATTPMGQRALEVVRPLGPISELDSNY